MNLSQPLVVLSPQIKEHNSNSSHQMHEIDLRPLWLVLVETDHLIYGYKTS